MIRAVEALRANLEKRPGVIVREATDGAFSVAKYQVGPVTVHLLTEYGTSRVKITYLDGPESPASFWLAAADGSGDVPFPAVTQEDLDRLNSRLELILDNAEQLQKTVKEIDRKYRDLMRKSLEL